MYCQHQLSLLGSGKILLALLVLDWLLAGSTDATTREYFKIIGFILFINDSLIFKMLVLNW